MIDEQTAPLVYQCHDNTWYQITKCLIRDGKLPFVLGAIEQINEEVSDEQWFEKKYPAHIFKEVREVKRVYKSDNKLKDLINTKLKITDVAKKYGLDTDKRGKTTCPFHFDNDPSLSLDDKKNVFYCFGCHAKGDILTFIKKMEETRKDGDEKGRRTDSY